MTELQETLAAAGFSDFEHELGIDVFDGAPQQSHARQFGARGMCFRAVRR